MELLEQVDAAVAEMRSRIHAIGPDDWNAPTLCEGWKVRDLVNHLLAAEVAVRPMLAGETLDEFTVPAWARSEDPIALWEAAVADAREAFGEDGALEVTVRHPVAGEMPGAFLAAFRATDNAVHAWDLAMAIGADTKLSPELVTELLGLIEPAQEFIQASGVFAEPIDVAPDADPQTQLLALLGRKS
jgi:uncharacterized protein (TIGR03086 family)